MKTARHMYEVNVGDRVLMKLGDYAPVARIEKLGAWSRLHFADGRKSDELYYMAQVWVWAADEENEHAHASAGQEGEQSHAM